MNEVLLDAVGVIAVLNRQDQWHEPAMKTFVPLQSQSRLLSVTTFVMAEVGNSFACTPLRAVAAAFHRQLFDQGRLIVPTESDWALAWRAFEQAPPGGPSIVDCVSFEVMRRLGLRRVFTNDQHFADAGFETLF